MRGDWIHDWVRVEMDYRAGLPRTAPGQHREPARAWKALWVSVFPPRRAHP
ncbi:hypothetical protein ABJI51_10900 [Amycolatopsis sp. NEAU-NG30]|uniref:Uncharacterized protein n=1 Tax=Amycolatopsis melonis TaxID=3156488 RepID=A0ABV0LBB9_9PSEU